MTPASQNVTPLPCCQAYPSWLRHVVKITDPNKPFYSHRHTATSYLRNTRLPDGSPAVKEDIERYILGHAGKGHMPVMASGGSRH
jgi:hypothetical protein